jgi:hypothetical protein
MKLAELPEQVEPLVILGDDNNYLTVYTCMSNEDTIELLRRSLHVLEMEQEQADNNLHLH